ncbi:hypothetical protein [Microcystis aeruginosa]|uniref:Uncharacterized protein n=1 Tax=Microcystis aeruginosa NIES-2521 TaxID=2303983 RepID=A0A5A5S0E2_MICAE|nr:hypothetical protein [Microcystis aeruginosa]GCA80369.1 hypothetical protein MiTs_02376 [Microcystis aeruginosa NIES-2521]
MKTKPIELWLSLAVSPLLLSYLALRSLDHWLIELGRESEEVFRGDRLPLLNIADQLPVNSDR